jgi:hypothetical protein
MYGMFLVLAGQCSQDSGITTHWLTEGISGYVLALCLPPQGIHTHHSRFILNGVAEASQIFFRDTYILP